jgi:biopolymer transport protein ExbD
MRDGQIYFRSSLVRTRDLSGVIRSAVKDGAENKVYLAVDRRTLYRDVNVVVNQIRLAGLSDICFIAAHRTPNLESR